MPEIIRSPSTTQLDVEYELYYPDEIQQYTNKLASEHAELNTAAFSLEIPTTHDEAARNLSLASLYIRARAKHTNLGFATYEKIVTPGGLAIYQSRGLTPSAQGLQLGRTFVRIAAEHTSADYLIAKAQNPISIWSTMQSGLFEIVYPIDALFSESQEMTTTLEAVVDARGKAGRVDLSTGLLARSYKVGKLGNYAVKNHHTGASNVERRLEEIGVNPDEGDAVYYGGRIVNASSTL